MQDALGDSEGMHPPVSQALTLLRNRKGLTQSELASQLEVSPATVSRIEAGKRDPSLILLLRWIELCDGQLQLLGEAAPPAWAEGLDPRQAYIIQQLHTVAPLLNPTMWDSLGALVDTWAKISVKNM